MKNSIFAFICLFLAIPCQARKITVDANGSADFDNIQAAIDDSNDGDIVEVQTGTYTGPGNRDIDFGGNPIDTISGLIDDGALTAYDGAGSFNIDYDNINTTVTAVCPVNLVADLNRDCIVNFIDLSILAALWHPYRAPDANHLRAHYAFDETSGTAISDSSGNGFDATISSMGTGSWDPAGRHGGCLEFAGTQVDSNASVFDTLDDEITFSLWANIDVDNLNNGDNKGLLWASDYSLQLRLPKVRSSGQQAVFRVGGDAGGNEGSSVKYDYDDINDPALYGWHHYAFTKDTVNDIQRIYRDGVLVAEDTNATKPLDYLRDTATEFKIGYYTNGNYSGKLDELRIYDYELSQAEIVSLVIDGIDEGYPLSGTVCSNMVSSSDNNAVNIEPYLEIDGVETDPTGIVSVNDLGSKIIVDFEAPSTADYRFGVSLEAAEIHTLELGAPVYDAGSLTEPRVIPYPYDWTYVGQNNVHNKPYVVMPGVIFDGQVYIADTHELFSVTLEAKSGNVRALLLKHDMYNDGADVGTSELSMSAGQTDQLEILIFDDINTANEEIYGKAPPINGRMTNFYYKGWTNPSNYLTPSQHEVCAEHFEGVFDWVILRTIEPNGWMADIFHNHGIKALSYHYMGGLRRNSSQVTQDIIDNYSMIGSDGQLYTAPNSPDGNWLLLDIRDPNARDLLVQRAVNDVNNGFDGIYLDGYKFRPDSAGRRGGNVPEANCSLAYARWLLLKETKEAIKQVNPNAILFILANHYYGTLGIGDAIMKERMYWSWDDKPENYYERKTSVCQDLDLDVEKEQTPFIANNPAYGSRGYSPIAVHSALNFIRYPTGLYRVGLPGFYPEQYSAWSDTIAKIATQDDIYITKITPSLCHVHFDGQYSMYTEETATVEFSRPVIVEDLSAEEYQYDILSLQMEPSVLYRIVVCGAPDHPLALSDITGVDGLPDCVVDWYDLNILPDNWLWKQ